MSPTQPYGLARRVQIYEKIVKVSRFFNKAVLRLSKFAAFSFVPPQGLDCATAIAIVCSFSLHPPNLPGRVV